MPYKRGTMKGELTTTEIRKLIRAHNVLMSIKIPPKTTRDGIFKILDDKGYMVNHVRKSIQRRYKNERKPNITIDQAEKILPKPKPRAKKPDPAPAPKEDKKKALAIEDKPKKEPAKKEDRGFKVEARERTQMINALSAEMKKKINPYKVLGITRATETPALVKQRCKELRLKEHPDKGGDPVKFDLFQKVCKILLDTQTLTKKSGNDKDKGEAKKKPVKDMTPEEQFELFKKTKPSQLNVSRYLANLFLDSTGGTKQKDITMWANLKGLKDVDKILKSKSKANKTKRDALIAGLKEFVKLAKDEGWKTINAPTDHYDFLGEEQDFQNPEYDIGDISNRELMEIIELVGKYLGKKVEYDISKITANLAGRISNWGGTIFSFGALLK